MPNVVGDKITANVVTVAIGTVSARNGSDLAAGSYLLTTTTACFIRQGDSTVTVASDGADAGAFIPAGGGITLSVGQPTAEGRIAVVQQTAGGRLHIQKLDAAV